MSRAMAVAAVSVGLSLGACMQRPPEMGDQEARAALVRTPPACNTESGFDPDRSHHSRRYRIAEGVLVTIVPHSQSNQHSLSQLAAGQIVGKFVNQGERGHDPLSLAPRGESCLRIRSVVEDGRELMIAEAIPPGRKPAAGSAG